MNEKVFAWIDIPVQDMERAVTFYRKLCGHTLLNVEDTPTGRRATLYFEEGKVGGTLVERSDFAVDGHGPRIYMNAGKTLRGLQAWITKVESAGGKIIAPAAPLEELGYHASFRDSEGNVIWLFAQT